MPPFLSVYLSSANNPKTPIPTTDRPNSTFYEDTIRLVKFYFRVVLTLAVDLTWLVTATASAADREKVACYSAVVRKVFPHCGVDLLAAQLTK